MERQLYLLATALGTGWLLSTTDVAQAQLTGTNTDNFQHIEQPLPLKATTTTLGIGLIGFELWWFLFSRAKTKTEQSAAKKIIDKQMVATPRNEDEAVLLSRLPVASTQTSPPQDSGITALESSESSHEENIHRNSCENNPPEKFEADLCTLYNGIEMARAMLMVEHRIQPRFSMG
ncbi:MAG: hypothetical protein AAGC93_08915 [Cyanobacteria bacterium P01_F01_bin.53]